ncbi:DUF4194 domain-containing protein [Pollutimonas sp. M17]|uniref:DUF4194 domain-containing protein n=1 Tax=Pollutimonas sp. M17 TaxID=2962065 RepID=UPI0021F43203|nr:DUF4194 domain-containing protein [Pollutimonas sp. M17]UYO92816.1 DUF4194 domain-containing protein [Pollutimonas sp. M17]
MSQYWELLASRSDDQHTSEELEMTAYRLAVEQVLYYADRHSRTAYWMIERYEREFRQALVPLGIDVQVNRQLRYAYALPKHAKAGTASIAQTVFALVLRAIYDEAASIGQLTEGGEVLCDLVELAEKYRLMSGKELPTKGKLDSLMETMKRWGIAKKSEDHGLDDGEDMAGQPYAVVIRPAIADVLGEAALARLVQFKAVASANDEPEAVTSVAEEGESQE